MIGILLLLWWMGMLFTYDYCDSVSPRIWDVSGLPLRWRLWCAFGLLVLWPLYLAVALGIPLGRRK